MEIRKITPEDLPGIKRLHGVAYTFPVTDLSVKDEDLPWQREGWGAFDGARPVSVMMTHPFSARHDGRNVDSCGIGGVATYPEARRKGLVARIFERAFAEMRDRGQAFSTLYPFSFPYYRRFGYESIYSRNEYTFPLDQWFDASRSGNATELTGYAPTVQTLHEALIAGTNIAHVRSRYEWERRFRQTVEKDLFFSYLVEDDGGRPAAFVSFAAVKNGEHSYLIRVRDLGLRHPADLALLLSWLGLHHPRATSVELHLPTGFRPELLFVDGYCLKHRLDATLMGRIVDVPKALEASAFAGDADDGHFTIAVTDDVLEWNNGTFHVEWDAGGVRVKHANGGAAADVEMDVRTLAQAIYGFVDGATLASIGKIKGALADSRLARLFPERPLYQNDHF